MSGKYKTRVIVLFPSELRAAAKAFGKLRKDKPSEEELQAALMLTEQALWHLIHESEPAAYLTLAVEPDGMERAAIVKKEPKG